MLGREAVVCVDTCGPAKVRAVSAAAQPDSLEGWWWWQLLCLTWAVLMTNEFCQVGGKEAGSCAFASFVAVQTLFMSGKGVWRSIPLRRGMKE